MAMGDLQLNRDYLITCESKYKLVKYVSFWREN